MNRTPRALGLASLALLPSLLLSPAPAEACGGCFAPTPVTEGSVVVAHRMALSISNAQTVLWDQIQYTGSPTEFAWVLPVKPGARVELASDAWFDTLEAATSRVINPPALSCNNQDDESSGSCSTAGTATVGCSASDSGGSLGGFQLTQPDPVSVVHHGSAGPYEAVVIHSDVPGALSDWLEAHGYPIPDDVEPIIDAYANDGFDFVALRLLPAQGVQQMKPIRVIQPGAVPTLPLRMVAAGTGANTAITLFVIGEGRWTLQDFQEVPLALGKLDWDFNTNSSTYAALRLESLALDEGKAWIAPYAQPRALLSTVENAVTRAVTPYLVGQQSFSTIGEAYVEQAMLNGETSSRACVSAFAKYANSAERVVDPCDDEGVCGKVGVGEIDARELMCAPPIGSDLALADLSVALTGMHPRDVWLTRLESNLPRSALSIDLTMKAAPDQSPVPAAIVAATATGGPCPVGAGAPPPPQKRRADPRAAFGLSVVLIGLLAIARRLARSRPVRAANELGEVKA